MVEAVVTIPNVEESQGVPNGIKSDKHFFFPSKWFCPAEPDVARQREDGSLPRRGDELGALGQVKNKPLIFANFTLMGLVLFFIPSLN